MMSEERETLITDLSINAVDGFFYITQELQSEIRELLAQPEQEPVAWMSLSDIEWMNIVNHPKILELTDGRHNSEEAVNLAVKMTEEKCKKNNSDSIPKREPLSDEEMRAIWKEGVRGEIPFVEIGRAIEKAHGIGEDDE
jgi:hypothetical protein